MQAIPRAPFATLLALCNFGKKKKKKRAITFWQIPHYEALIYHLAKCNAVICKGTLCSALIDETNACAKSWEMASMKFKGTSDLFKHLYLCLGNFLCHENKKDTLPKKNQVLGQIKYLKKKLKTKKIQISQTRSTMYIYIETDGSILHVQNDVWQPWQKEIIPTALSIPSIGVCNT